MASFAGVDDIICGVSRVPPTDEMGRPTVYSFWEPAGRLPAYLQLSRSTWELGFPGYEQVQIDYSTLGDYVDSDVFDFDFLRRLTVPMQVDAIEVAVLAKHGGLFMDMDTIAVADVSPVLHRLLHSEVVMFGRHMAFVAARPGAHIMELWLRAIQQRLEFASRKRLEPRELPWGFAGNDALADVLDALTGVGTQEPPIQLGSRRQDMITARLRRRFLLASRHRREIAFLNRRKFGFIAETAKFHEAPSEPRDRYESFWFDADLPIDAVFTPRTTVIGLHHSWTPDWYTGLSTDEVLDHECLLSRVLRHVISGNDAP